MDWKGLLVIGLGIIAMVYVYSLKANGTPITIEQLQLRAVKTKQPSCYDVTSGNFFGETFCLIYVENN